MAAILSSSTGRAVITSGTSIFVLYGGR